MSVVKMHRLTLVGLTEQKADVMEALIRLGAIEVDELTPQHAAAATSSYDERSVSSINAISRLEIAATTCRMIDPNSQKLGMGKRLISPQHYADVLRREPDILADLRTFEQLQDQVAQIKTHQVHDRTLSEILLPWKDLTVDLSVSTTRETVVFLGAFPTQDLFDAFSIAVQTEAPETYIEKVHADASGIRAAIATLKIREGVVHALLRQHEYHLLPISGQKGQPAEILQQIADRSDDQDRRIVRLENEIIQLSARGSDFELLHDQLLLLSDKLDALQHVASTASTFYLTGWIPGEIAKDLAGALKTKFAVAVETRLPQEGEEPPVLFDNHPLVKPYEIIVEMFSPPSSADVDPSPILAPFFFFFFGMMLSDVGYGLVLTALTAWLAFKKKAEGELGQMARMLFLSGIGATLWGFLFGGFFGNLLSTVTEGRIQSPVLWFDPMKDPMTLMIWSMLFGILHLYAAMGVKIYMNAKAGQLIDGLLDVAPWYLIITGLGLMLGGDSIIPGVSLKFAGQVMAIAGAGVILLFGGRDTKNPIMRLVKGLLALYNVTAYFSDILSYTRILALVLATSVIAMVVNMLGFMGGPTPVGYITFTIAALFGHTLNLALSALSAYVHTSRLHYVEFFGKFYEGGGKLFNPLKTRSKFIKISKP